MKWKDLNMTLIIKKFIVSIVVCFLSIFSLGNENNDFVTSIEHRIIAGDNMTIEANIILRYIYDIENNYTNSIEKAIEYQKSGDFYKKSIEYYYSAIDQIIKAKETQNDRLKDVYFSHKLIECDNAIIYAFKFQYICYSKSITLLENSGDLVESSKIRMKAAKSLEDKNEYILNRKKLNILEKQE